VPTTLVATAEPSNDPPRVLIEIEYTGQVSADIVRNDPDGRAVPVRLADPVTLDGSGEATVYDYESWFGQATTYTATTGGGSIDSNSVSLDVDDIWLRHPALPTLSMAIDFQGEGEPVRAVNQAVLEPLGRRTPIVVSDGRRRGKRGTITIRTETDEQHEALLALVDDVTALLLDVPPGKLYGPTLTHQYLALGDLQETRHRPDYYPWPRRIWTCPYIVVDRPADTVEGDRTWANVLAEAADWAELVGMYDTWGDVLTGTTS
jgi:hypothetical protein